MTPSTVQAAVYAGTGIRAVALLLDLILVILVAGAGAEAGLPYPIVFPLLMLGYLIGMPLSPLQGTLGKWICRIRLCDRVGRKLSLRASALRAGATAGWVALCVYLEMPGWLVFALPWAPVAFLPRKESLFDRLAGSLVVRYRADAESVARAEPVQKPGFFNVAGALILCVGTGAVFGTALNAAREKDLRVRIVYAIGETLPLREKIDAFAVREQRWPTAAELGVQEWTPYPAGGGYRLQDRGILITFSVLPELKGHSIALRPVRGDMPGKVEWRCFPSPGLKQNLLPASCRPPIG